MLFDVFSASKAELIREISRLNMDLAERSSANAKLVMEKAELEALLPMDVKIARMQRLVGGRSLKSKGNDDG